MIHLHLPYSYIYPNKILESLLEITEFYLILSFMKVFDQEKNFILQTEARIIFDFPIKLFTLEELE